MMGLRYELATPPAAGGLVWDLGAARIALEPGRRLQVWIETVVTVDGWAWCATKLSKR